MGLWNTHAERTGVALAGGAVLLVGGSVAASSLLAGYPVLGGQAIRYAAAGLLLAGWARLRRHPLPRRARPPAPLPGPRRRGHSDRRRRHLPAREHGRGGLEPAGTAPVGRGPGRG